MGCIQEEVGNSPSASALPEQGKRAAFSPVYTSVMGWVNGRANRGQLFFFLFRKKKKKNKCCISTNLFEKVYSESNWRNPVYSHLVQREHVCEHDPTNTMQSDPYTLAGCFMTQFNSDCIYLEEHQTPQAKSSEARLLSTPNALFKPQVILLTSCLLGLTQPFSRKLIC